CGWSNAQLDDLIADQTGDQTRLLTTWVAERCKQADKPVWFVIDDCDDAGLPRESIAYVLALATESAKVANMRLVLLGRIAGLDGISGVVRESIRPVSERDCVE